MIWTNSAMRTLIKYLDTLNRTVWQYQYLIEVNNLANSNYTDPFVLVEYKSETWSQRSLK